MTWNDEDNTQWPTPLRQQKGSLGKVARDYVQDTEETRGEAAAYARVLARTTSTARTNGGSSRRIPRVAVPLAMAVVVVVLVLRPHTTDVSKPQAKVASQSASSNASSNASSKASSKASSNASPSAHSSDAKEWSPAATPTDAPSIPSPKTASIRLRDVPCSLPAGQVDLDGQAMAVLSAEAIASGHSQKANTEIVLKKGSIDLRVVPRAKGQSFAVRAGPYQFTVVGTAFTVSRTQSRLELVVREGKVAVSRGTRRLATVNAGGTWVVEANAAPAVVATPAAAASVAAALVAAPPPAAPAAFALAPTPAASAVAAPSVVSAPAASPFAQPAPAAPLATRPVAAATKVALVGPAAPSPVADPRRYCGALSASKRPREALLCYQEQATQSGLVGETAQYEVARLWRDSLAEPERALAAFKAQRSRFPSGALRTEADLSIIELLPRLGRHAEAMTETERFLIAHPKAERRGEIHLLRGNIFREVLRDLGQAEREYAWGIESGGKVGDDCRFLRAVCLEALGHVEEARRAFEVYLLGNKGTHIEDARRRLERLHP